MKLREIMAAFNGLTKLQIDEVLNEWDQISNKHFLEIHIIKIEIVGSNSWHN